MHNLDAYVYDLLLVCDSIDLSTLTYSFTVRVCASYRGRGLGSTLCKSLVTHAGGLSLCIRESVEAHTLTASL